MNRILVIIVTLYVAFGVWVVTMPDPKLTVPAENVPIEAGPIAGSAGVPELMAPAGPRVTTQKRRTEMKKVIQYQRAENKAPSFSRVTLQPIDGSAGESGWGWFAFIMILAFGLIVLISCQL